ncbi:MAG: 4Fe-4S binding protein [Methanomicrobia archaeon]|nr:4Fe-4S binding protein [Methanomicrobia archaeon]RLF92862.1 MAG: ferredoxin [Thermococci archaeon]RLF95576.1 MAG: ferredoxin [Thermococci archaeon]
MPKVIVDKEKCIGCGTCAENCPVDVYEIKDGKAVPVNEDACIACRLCESQCPEGAITIED